MIHNKPDLIIFDCDGVLVDTEKTANEFMAKVLSSRGLPISGEVCRKRFVGLKLETVRQKILAEDRIDIGADFAEAIYSRLDEVFSSGVEAIPHIHDAVLAIKAVNIPYCVASSGQYRKMNLTLGSCELLPLFKDVLFSAWDVERGKPFPDLFLLAAKKMGFAPEKCAVVEDAVPGIQAAKAAGMRALAYVGDPMAPEEELAENGGELFSDMRELPSLLGLEAV